MTSESSSLAPTNQDSEVTAYFIYHDHERSRTFRWDGRSETIELVSGSLVDPHIERVPLSGHVYNPDYAHGWLAWFQAVCCSHIRYEQANQEST